MEDFLQFQKTSKFFLEIGGSRPTRVWTITWKYILYKARKSKLNFYENQQNSLSVYTDSFTFMISFVFSSWAINDFTMIITNFSLLFL